MSNKGLHEEDAGTVAARTLEALRAVQDHEVVLQGVLESGYKENLYEKHLDLLAT